MENLNQQGKLSLKGKIGYSLGSYGINITNALVTAFLLVYYVSVVGINSAVAASIIAVSKIFDGISDLIMGYIVDHTHSKFGKARPWMIRLALPLAVCTVIMFSVPQNLTGSLQIAFIFISYNLVNGIFYTGMYVPFNALNGLMTLKQYERGLLGNFSILLSTAATMTVNTVLLKLVQALGNGDQYDHKGWTLAIIILMVVAVISNILCFWGCEEVVNDTNNGNNSKQHNSIKEILKCLFTNKYWVIMIVLMFVLYLMMTTFFGSGLYFAQYRMNNSGLYATIANALSLIQIVTMFITPFIMKKVSKRNLLLSGMAISGVAFALTELVVNNATLVIILSAVKGIGFAFAAAPIYGMLQDAISFGEWKSGIACIGMGNAAASFCQKLGSGLGTVIMGWALSLGQFDVDPTKASALAAIDASFIWIPFICTVISVIALFFYNLDKEFNKVADDLANGKHMGDA